MIASKRTSLPSSPPPYLCLYGPTGSGKSRLGLALAEKLGGEIINADSVQCYRGFNLGAAKPDEDEQRRVPHHLLDIVSWHEDFTAGEFARQGRRIMEELGSRQVLPLVIGGSGLYLRCLWGENFHPLPQDAEVRAALVSKDTTSLYHELCQRDPQRARELHPNDRVRVIRSLEVCLVTGQRFSDLTARVGEPTFPPCLKIFLNPPKEALHEALILRIDAMFRQGLLDEVRALLAAGCPRDAKPMQSIGYKQVVDYFDGKLASEAAVREQILLATRQYAKRQLTWFKKVPCDVELQQGDDKAIEEISSILSNT